MARAATADLERELRGWLEGYRRRTYALLAPLDDDDLHRQFDRIMSPLVWDLGHVANFEELWLLRELHGRAPRDPVLDRVYNPFDNPRWVRSDLPILPRLEALAYLEDVRAEALALMPSTSLDPAHPLLDHGYVYAMVAQHEAQHQETMFQALDLRGDLTPYEPAAHRHLPPRRWVDDTERVVVAGAPFVMGTDDRRAAYDNERPGHRVEVAAFAIDRYPTTARRYGQFVAAGGYEQPEWWSEPGWVWRGETGHEAPQGWLPDGEGGWVVRRFGHVVPLDPAEPVQHACFWEAEAFARWSGARLPTEAEWEKAARWDPATGRSRAYPWGDEPPTPRRANLDHRAWGPAPVGSYPAGVSALGVEQMVGDVYEWTASRFGGYPGYESFPYREYSEVFFGDEHTVLRGASWATSPLVARATFRNWDFPERRQIFAGLRLAWDP